MEIEIGKLIKKAKLIRCGDGEYPVLSMTMHDGLMFQNDRFKKQIASIDQSQYQVVHRHQLVESFPIDEGVLAVQELTDMGIVSPAYKIWDVDMEKVVPKYLEFALRAPRSIEYYKSKLRGTTARRRSIPDAEFCAMRIEYPSLNEQKIIVDIIEKAKQVINLRSLELDTLDALIKARFVELFGDSVSNPYGYLKDKLEKHIDLLSGYPFKSEQYVEEGVNICGGLIIMPQKIKWNECVHWNSEEGFEDYLLNENDIVMALDRPWISEGLKMAKVDAEHLPALLIQRTARIRAIDINQDYLYYCFINGGFDKHSNITGSLVPHISAKDIRSFEIMIPPAELQKQFADFVHQVDKSKVAVQKALDETQLLFDSLMQKYFI